VACVRRRGNVGVYHFHDVNVGRVRRIWDLRDQMDIDEVAIPVVRSLLDQLYDLRRRTRQPGESFCKIAPPDVQGVLGEHLAQIWRSAPT
jgi:chaperone modulatory protein CbpM